MIRILQQDNRITKALFAVIIGAAIITMVITLVPGIFDNGNGGASDTYAVVRAPGMLGRFTGDTRTITMQQVQRQAAAMAQQQNLPAMYISFILPQVEQRLVAQAVLRREADRLGLQVTNDDLLHFLQYGPYSQVFFPGGKFIGTDAYLSLIQNQVGTSVADFEDELKGELEIQRLQSLITGGITVSDQAVRDDYRKQGTKIKFDYAVIAAADVKNSINPNDADLQSFFKSNSLRYAQAIPETRKLSFFSIGANDLPGGAPTVSDAEVQAYYNAHLSQYKTPEQVQTRHILITVPRGADAKTDQLAKAKAEDVLKQVQAGGNFAALATKYSDDPGSKDKGGELPMIATSGLDPAYAKAAMALSPGQTSGLVRSQFGYHIIQTEKKDVAGTQPLSAVKDSIEPLLLQQKAGADLQNYANTLAADAKKNGLVQTAAAHHLNVTTTGYVAQTGVIPSLADSTSLLKQAFVTAKGAAPATVSTSDGFAVFQVDDIKAAHAPEFASYKDQILADYREQKAPELLAAKLNQLDAEAKKDGDLKKAAAAMNLPLKSSDLVGRDGQVPDLGAMSGPGAPAFDLAQGAISGPINTGTNGVVLQVTEKQEPSAADIQSNFAASRDKLLGERQGEYFNTWAQTLIDSYTKSGAVSINQKTPASPLEQQ
jgi:peptidyl-prolyl cis-trans isomerase D